MSSRLIALAALTVAALAGAMPAAAVPPDPLQDHSGKRWRQLYETTSAGWSQVAQVCPRDGVTPCSGSIGAKALTGWVWATADQVVELMGAYEPAILSADPPSMSGGAYFGSAQTFLGEMRWTGNISTSPATRSGPRAGLRPPTRPGCRSKDASASDGGRPAGAFSSTASPTRPAPPAASGSGVRAPTTSRRR
jgi:hypothetical protein